MIGSNVSRGICNIIKLGSLAALLVLSQPALAKKAPEFPPPPDAAVEWVAQDIEMNGNKTAIRAFHSQDSIEKVVEFYRKEWRRPPEKDKPGFMETIDAAPWYIITRIEDGYLLTVQVQIQKNDENASWGIPIDQSFAKEP